MADARCWSALRKSVDNKLLNFDYPPQPTAPIGEAAGSFDVGWALYLIRDHVTVDPLGTRKCNKIKAAQTPPSLCMRDRVLLSCICEYLTMVLRPSVNSSILSIF